MTEGEAYAPPGPAPVVAGGQARPLSGRRFLIDGPSVAREGLLPGQLPRLDRIRQVLAALAAEGVAADDVAVIVDGLLAGEIDDLGGLLALVQAGRVQELPPGDDLVGYLLTRAAAEGAVLVTCRRRRELRRGGSPAAVVLRPLFEGERVRLVWAEASVPAGLGRRFAAFLVDGLILWVVQMVIVYLLAAAGGVAGGEQAGQGAALGGSALVMAASLLYRPLFEASPWQATPGKRLLGIYVARVQGGRLGLGRALVRELARSLCVLTLGIGYLMALANRRRQGLHDWLAGAVVLRRASW